MATGELKDQLQAALGSTYTLDRELGRGGMATVFLALDAKHGRSVALKVLHADLAASLGPERFRREIAFAARLQHPHILSVLDSGETSSGLLWFTMPYVEGESLRQRLTRERQIPVSEAIRLTREVALALDYAHRHGVMHRDVKPENILLIDGQAMVADFGIARALKPGSDTSQTLTETGVSLGTPTYMSPEQASGQRELDGRTDIYSLGAVLYEMLAGEPPFTGPNAQTVIARRFTERPRLLRTVRETVPEALERAVDTALAKAPADRYATAADFAKALDVADRTTSAPAVASAAGPIATPAIAPPTPSAPVRRKVPIAATSLALGFLVGVGVLFAWRSHSASGTAAAGPGTLAVLPFDNLGDSADAYFADGMTDEVRSKLGALPGVQVIASSSSSQYRRTAKPPEQIGRELGVRYLLIGRVRWEKLGGQSRVRVDPELIQVADVPRATMRWEQAFDADLSDVFQVQSDIASKVAQELKVALTPATQQTLAQRPTQNLDAYDAYLRGKEIERGGHAPVIERRAAASYRQAVQLDSTFALAWVGLAEAYSWVFANGVPMAAVGDSAHMAAAKAVALAPDLPEAHAAMGRYYSVVSYDIDKGLAEYSAALARSPNNVTLLGLAAGAERSLGRWPAADAHLQQAARLDPRDAGVDDLLGTTELWRHNYAGAQAELDRARAREPGNVSLLDHRVMVALGQGDLSGARSIISKASATIDSATLVAYLAEYNDLGWVLDSAYERVLLGLGPGAFDNDRSNWGIVMAQQYAFRGEMNRARAYADTARAAFEAVLKATPQDGQQHVLLGLSLAYLGRKADAVREGERGVALLPISKDAYGGAYVRHQLTRIYLLVGEPEKALDELEPLLKIPFYLSPGWLRIDPNFAPLRSNPRFERLVAGT